MAVKNHSLDDRIVEAATAEFLARGFRGASLRQIAQRAGITTGALYTRYKNKDILFCSLVEPAWNEITVAFEPMQQIYMEAQLTGNPESIIDAIKKEAQIYLNLMFEYYDQCVLFFCRSDGSSIQTKIELLMEEKARQTAAFFRSIAKEEIDFDGIEFILSEQFHYYRQLLEKGYDKQKAVSCMKIVEHFWEAGWRDLLRQIM